MKRLNDCINKLTRTDFASLVVMCIGDWCPPFFKNVGWYHPVNRCYMELLWFNSWRSQWLLFGYRQRPGGSHHLWADPFPELVTCLKRRDLSEVQRENLANKSFHTLVVALEALFKRGNGLNIVTYTPTSYRDFPWSLRMEWTKFVRNI